MDVLAGIIYLILLCGSILMLSAIPISFYHKTNRFTKKKAKDYYSVLFDVYE